MALKVLSPAALGTPELRERFYRKIKILARLSHPNLVALYDAGQRDATHYMTMEYVDGEDLVGWMRQYGPIPVDLAVNYLAQAAAGLGYAHGQGVYHRNVKPANLLLDRQGVVRVIGFGLAWVEPEAETGAMRSPLFAGPGQVVGTLDYMAPEQAIDGNRIDGRADIYGLGCTLYAVLTGRLPYPARWPAEKVLAHREDPIPSIHALRPDVPEALDAVVSQDGGQAGRGPLPQHGRGRRGDAGRRGEMTQTGFLDSSTVSFIERSRLLPQEFRGLQTTQVELYNDRDSNAPSHTPGDVTNNAMQDSREPGPNRSASLSPPGRLLPWDSELFGFPIVLSGRGPASTRSRPRRQFSGAGNSESAAQNFAPRRTISKHSAWPPPAGLSWSICASRWRRNHCLAAARSTRDAKKITGDVARCVPGLARPGGDRPVELSRFAVLF